MSYHFAEEPEALTRRLTVPEAVRVYEQAMADMRAACAQIAAAEDALKATFSLGEADLLRLDTRYGNIDFHAPEEALTKLRRQVWDALIDRTEIRRMMSIERAKELDKEIESGDMPEITEQSVAALVRGFSSQLPAMLQEAVEEVHAWLRPRNDRYKRNSQLDIPHRVVLERICEVWVFGKPHVRWEMTQHLRALENVFTALDGKGQITKAHQSELHTAIDAKGREGPAVTEYFEARVFKNGNMHLTFLREDLLAKLNAIAGGKRLRPGSEAA